MDQKKKEPEKVWVRSLALFSMIVVDLLGYSLAGLGLGYLAWAKLGAPWWVVIGSAMLGLTASMFQLYRLSNRENDRNDNGKE